MGVLLEATRHIGLDAIVAASDWISLHTDDPGTDGSNEVTGGTPAYTRQQGTFSAASGGERALATDLDFDVPACTVKWVGCWSASSGGTFRGKHQVSDEVFATQGVCRVKATTTKFQIIDG